MMPSTSNEEDENFLFAMHLASASVLPMVLRAALEMDVLEIIAKAGPGAYLSPAEITTHLPTNNPEAPDMIDRILRLLATYSVVACTQIKADDGRVQILYGLTPACKFLVQNQDGVSIAPLLLLLQDKVFMESWYHLKDTLFGGGIAFNRGHGMNSFEYQAKDSRFNEVFNRGMKNHSTIAMKRVLEIYRGFEGVKELVDVGGGVGASLDMIVSKYPHIKGINFDLPHVVADAPSYSSGVVHSGGDMFVSVPHGDAIFMKWILHDWSDEKCLKLLKNCYQALADSGKVIVIESIPPPFPETNLAANCVFQLDMLMLAFTPGGKERTEKEFETLGKAAGFACFKPVCSAYCYRVMEFHKNV